MTAHVSVIAFLALSRAAAGKSCSVFPSRLAKLWHHVPREQLHGPHHVRVSHLTEGHAGPEILDVVPLPESADALHDLLWAAKVRGGLQLRLIARHFHRAATPPLLQVQVDFAATGQRPTQAVQVPHPNHTVSGNFDRLLGILGHVHMPEEGHVLRPRIMSTIS